MGPIIFSLPEIVCVAVIVAVLLVIEAGIRSSTVERERADREGLMQQMRTAIYSIERHFESVHKRLTGLAGQVKSSSKAVAESREDVRKVQVELSGNFAAWNWGRPTGPLRPNPRPAAKGIRGLREILKTNRVECPCNAAAYDIRDLLRDTIAAARGCGGWPDVLLVSSDVITAFTAWKYPPERSVERICLFGLLVPTFEVCVIAGVKIIVAPTLDRGTAIALDTPDIRATCSGPAIGASRPHLDDRGLDLKIEVGDESKHAWVEGILAFAAC